MMNPTALIVLALVCLSACATQDESRQSREDPVTAAIRDFIDVRQLEEADNMATGSNDGWMTLNDRFIIYNGRRDSYLVEFVRRCYELTDNSRITPDRRWDSNYIRAKFDTIRGCRIAAIYPLTEAEIAELENIGETPGSRN
jgi:hypothetical protein